MEDKNVPVVEVKDLVVHYETYDGVVEAVNGVSFKIEKIVPWKVVVITYSAFSITLQNSMGPHIIL